MRLYARSLPAALAHTAAHPLAWLLDRLDDALCRANQPWSEDR